MADTLYFSRDSKVYAEIGATIWELPVLDGFSFSQATNASEITLNEMSDSNGNSRRARQMFTDSYAPAEWSFSTYIRPFKSAGTGSGAASDISGHTHAVEEVLWALMVGDAAYSNAATSGGAVATLSNVATFTALSGANKLGANATFTVPTTTDGDGSGATILLTYTETSGAIVATLGAEKGSGYTVNDKVFIGRQTIADALDVPLSAIITSDANNDFEATVASIATASGGTTFTGFTRDATDLNIDFDSSNKTTLGTCNLYFVMGGAGSGTKTTYKLEGAVVNEASIDFDIDGIAMINWSGFAKIITEDTAPTATITEAVASTSNFIRNRLTNLVISSTSPTATTYNLVLTGGNITISNNLTFLTPETLGVVNQPLGHVTGTRAVSGNFTCYLNAESDSSANLFENIIENPDTITNNFDLNFKVGGTAAGTPRVEFSMANCHLELPTHSIEDVISLDTNFHALPSTISETDELIVTYYGV